MEKVKTISNKQVLWGNVKRKSFNKMKKVLYIDGSYSKFVGSAYCIVISNKPFLKMPKKIKHIIKTINKKTNSSEIEYIALIESLKAFEKISIIFTDSLQVYEEMNNIRTPSKATKELYTQAKLLLNGKNIEIKKISRWDSPASFFLQKRLFKLHNHSKNTFRFRSKI